ncbi:MAG: hypothetical protein HYS41_06760 [Candidatus Omnitrophica bacterium]|nr:hypothetical protein [Candidatus Omnitrophota bacterium]
MLLLVDAPSCANWCHYAVSPRLGAKGRFRSAAHRLIALVLKLIKTEKPERVGVLFDGKLKAGSTQMPADLAKELPLIRRLLAVGGIPVLEFRDCAAAGLALPLLEQAKRKGMPALLVTTRSVFLQWVGPHVTLLNPAREKLRFDPDQVLKVFGVPPEKIPDRIALVGDDAEGIPGVKGVGPKRAAKLLAQYGGLEKILGALEELPPALAKALGEARERIRQGRGRAIVCESSLIGRDLLDRLVLSEAEPEQVTRQFTEAGFSDLLSDLLVHAHLYKTSYRTILTAEDLKETAEILRSTAAFGIDTETTGLDVKRAGLVGISLAVGPGKAFYLPVGHVYAGAPAQLTLEEIRPVLGPLLADASRVKAGQNIKFDLAVLGNAGLPVSGPLFDTMVASHLIHPDRRSHSLDDLSLAYLGFKMIPFKELAGDKESLAYVEIDRVAEYACEDADVTFQLYERFLPELSAGAPGRIFHEVEMPLVEVLSGVEAEGLPVDLAEAERVKGEAQERLGRLAQEIFESVGERFDLDSPKEIRRVLTQRLGIRLPHQTRAKQPSLSRSSLAKAAVSEPAVGKLLDYQEGKRFLKERLAVLARDTHPETGRFYLGVHQAATGTGRIRVSRFFSEEENGSWNLGLKGLARAPSGSLLLEAQYLDLKGRLLASSGKDPGQFVRSLLIQSKREGKVRTFFLGRERALPQINSANPVLRQAAEEEAVETALEGSCAEVIKLGLLRVSRRLRDEGFQAKVIFLLPDGFLLELPEPEEERVSGLAREEMEKAVSVTPPLSVRISVGQSWTRMTLRPA